MSREESGGGGQLREGSGDGSAPLVVMVGSTVYGIEPLLETIYAALVGRGYRVWMSHKGTVPTDPRLSNADNCVAAVEACDFFLGIITGRFGSGIFDQEVRCAVDLRKPRWFYVHHDVDVARQLLKQFRRDRRGRRRKLVLRPNPVLDDARVLDTYEYAMQHHVALHDRSGNWVQPYTNEDELLLAVDAQFSDVARVRELVRAEARDE